MPLGELVLEVGAVALDVIHNFRRLAYEGWNIFKSLACKPLWNLGPKRDLEDGEGGVFSVARIVERGCLSLVTKPTARESIGIVSNVQGELKGT